MKFTTLFFAICLGLTPAFAALSSTAIWEIRSGGATANSGYFNPGNANFPTDATATSATGNAPVISSATYNFVAGDVNAWIYIKAGTNWLPGWYKISSVAANAATVDATIGHGITLTNGVYAVTTVAGVASVASPTGGTYGVDYSQQAAAKLSLTDLASVGASTTITSITAGFTPVMVGNGIHLTTTGTGAHGIIGWYELVSYTNTSTMVTDQTTNDGTALVAGTSAIGGAILTVGAIGSATTRLGAVAGNQIFMNGSFTLAATDTLAFSGSATSPIKISGYGTYRSDGYFGRTAAGVLTTTNMPTLAYNSAVRMNQTGSWLIMETVNITNTSGVSAAVVAVGPESAVVRCAVANASTNASAQVLNTGARAVIFDNDLNLTGNTSGSVVLLGSGYERCIANRVRTVGTGPCINSNFASSTILMNTVFASGGMGIFVSATNAYPCIAYNTIAGSTGDGINIVTANTQLQCAIGNLVTDGSAYGINVVSASNAIFLAYNRTRDNTSGAINSGTNWVAATNYGAVTTDTGGPETDYVSAGSTNFNYNLIAASPATSSGKPASASIGALQRSQTAAAATQTSSGWAK